MKNNLFKLIRNKLNLTQDELGKALCLSNSQISKIENGEHPISKAHLHMLKTRYNLSDNFFQTGDAPIFNPPVPILSSAVKHSQLITNDYQSEILGSLERINSYGGEDYVIKITKNHSEFVEIGDYLGIKMCYKSKKMRGLYVITFADELFFIKLPYNDSAITISHNNKDVPMSVSSMNIVAHCIWHMHTNV